MNKPKTPPFELCEVRLHGWDSKERSWHGPIPLVPDPRATRAILVKLGKARSFFQGRIRCAVPGLPCVEFHTAVYDPGDTSVALVHLDGGHAGPVGIVALVPGSRRPLLRDDFGLELMTLMSFLGAPVNSGSEFAIHDYIEENLRKEPTATQIFALETADLSDDLTILRSAFFENLSAALLEWMAAREGEIASPGVCARAASACPIV